MAKYNVGDKVRVVNVEAISYGSTHYYNGMETEILRINRDNDIFLRNRDGDEGIYVGKDERHAIEHVERIEDRKTRKPRRSERISALETEVVRLKEEVESLKQAKNITINAPSVDEMMRLGKSVTMTPNQKRADVIERAKTFVGEGFNRWVGTMLCSVEYIVNPDKRTVVALLRWKRHDNRVVAKGFAKCDPSDVFNADIGKAIALGRALGLNVKEFEQAVQPTEVVVGMRAKVEGVREPYISTLVQNNVAFGEKENSVGFVRSNPQYLYAIVEDTDAVYE